MEAIIAILSCGCAAASAFLALRIGLEPRAPRQRIKARGWHERFAGWMEVGGHWVPVVRLSNLAMVTEAAHRLQPAVGERGLRLTWRGCVAFGVTCIGGGALLGLLVSLSLLGALVGALGACVALVVTVGNYERAIRAKAASQMPEVLRSLAAALGAGKSLPQAVEHAGRTLEEPLGPEFLKVSFEMKSGRPTDEAVDALCERVQAPGMALLATALQVSQRTGSSLNDLFARTARMVTEDVGLRRELEVKTSQVRLSARVVAAMPVLLAGVLILLSPDYRAGLALPGGRACLAVAALLDIAALGLVHRLMKETIT